MLKNLFAKLKQSKNCEEQPASSQADKSAFEGRSFDETEFYHKTNQGELKHSSLANRLSTKQYKKAVDKYLTINAAKADNWSGFNEMINPVSGVYLSVPNRSKPSVHEPTAPVQIPVLEIPPAEVLHEILDKMRDSASERNQSDEAHFSSQQADTYRRRFVLKMASDHNSPDEILRRLADEGDSAVRALVAENPSTPVDSLWLLARDPNSDIRYSLAENHAVAIEVLNHLSEDENPYVAQRAQKTLKRLSSHIVYEGVDFRSITSSRKKSSS